MKRRNQGFTVVELLVVMAIITILAALIFPVFAAAKEKNRQNTCMNNLKQLGTAFELYCQDYDSDWVAPVYLGRLYPTYVRSPQLYVCPSDPGIYNNTYNATWDDFTFAWEKQNGIASGCSYVYYPLVGPQWLTWPDVYGYNLSDLPIAACHIHLCRSNEGHLVRRGTRSRDSIIILPKDTHIARADYWLDVRKGPQSWH